MRFLVRSFVVVVLTVRAGIAWAAPIQVPSPLVSPDWLAGHQSSVVILDVRKDARSFAAEPAPPLVTVRLGGKIVKPKIKVNGHIAGATLIEYKTIRGKRKVGGRLVEKMILEKGAFEAIMRRAGVNDDSAVVIVSKGLGTEDLTMATRLYWQLKYYGHDNMGVLDGGMARWITEGRPVTAEAGHPDTGNWTAKEERTALTATSAEVAAAGEKGVVLIDSRPLSQYLGTAKREYVHAFGHIPEGRPFPSDLITGQGPAAGFLAADQYRQIASALGIDLTDPIITYCNSGHLASGTWFVISELLGSGNVKLYDGSMHQWTLEQRPVVTMSGFQVD